MIVEMTGVTEIYEQIPGVWYARCSFLHHDGSEDSQFMKFRQPTKPTPDQISAACDRYMKAVRAVAIPNEDLTSDLRKQIVPSQPKTFFGSGVFAMMKMMARFAK